jgi:POT family proton-dependent oligopeptide transporter
MITDLKTTQRRASYFIIGMVMWEFFSFYGMQAMLILYLTQKLHFSDSHAYAIFGSFTSLIYVTPIVGGWLADRYCGYRYATAWGCVLIILGHLTLGEFTQHGLYVGLSLLILGIGLFKGNSVCLIGDCYPGDPAGRSSAFTWYYVSGNLGAVASQFLCPYLAQTISWSVGFLAAAVGMMFGLILLLLSRRYFGWYKARLHINRWTKLNTTQQTLISIVGILISLAIVAFVLLKLLVASLLIIVSIISIFTFIAIYKRAEVKQHKALLMLGVLSLFACGFWIFDQQGSSSIVLFISRFVDRSMGSFTIPAASFQSINPLMVLTIGTLVALLWRYLGKHNITLTPVSKLTIGLLLLTLGFYVIATAAHLAIAHSVVIWLPILCLTLNGASEIFIDPVLLSSITAAAPAQSEGRLVAIYYLLTGAIANYLAGQVANLTVDPTQGVGTAITYHTAYMQFTWIAGAMFVALAIWTLWNRYKNNDVRY